MSEIEIRMVVNGSERIVRSDPCRTLLHLLREDLGLLSVKEGCGQGDCGSCVVVMDGLAVNACLVLAAQADSSEIITVEGLAGEGRLHPLQRQFMEHWAFQCGFCTPGMLMSCYALLLARPQPTPEEIREAIAGNLCRCTSYHSIVTAVLAAAEELEHEREGAPGWRDREEPKAEVHRTAQAAGPEVQLSSGACDG
jgi:carbon-monoxide dehydrogenase small subunit